jgi:hypothetical protein
VGDGLDAGELRPQLVLEQMESRRRGPRRTGWLAGRLLGWCGERPGSTSDMPAAQRGQSAKKTKLSI